MKEYPFLDLALSNVPLMEELEDAANRVIRSGRYLRGEQTALLEQELAQQCEVKHCIAVSNGLDALRLILRAYKEMGILHEDEKVIVPANTYVATVLAVSDNALVPCLCEPREDTMNMNSDYIESLLSPTVKAIMPVHLYGTPCWDDKMVKIAKHYNLKIIEDNAQAIGAKANATGINGTRTTGGLGDAAALSFYPTKNLGAMGDAGAVMTNDDDLAATVRAIANYGSDYRYHNVYLGLNCRIDEIQAAMLLVKLKYLPQETARRQQLARTYEENIDHELVKTPAIFDDMVQVWHQYVVRVKNRDAFRDYLKGHGVATDVHYATPPHLQPCYRQFKSYKLPITQSLAQEVVSLPIAHPIDVESVKEISQIINNYQG